MGFIQKQLPLDDLTTAQLLSVAIETSNLLGWVFGNIKQTGFIAYTNHGLFSWNAEIKLKIKNGLVTLESESRGDGLLDLRENKKNVQSFISTFESLKNTLTPDELASIYENLKANFI